MSNSDTIPQRDGIAPNATPNLVKIPKKTLKY
jgi:hypothetical protein